MAERTGERTLAVEFGKGRAVTICFKEIFHFALFVLFTVAPNLERDFFPDSTPIVICPTFFAIETQSLFHRHATKAQQKAIGV